MPSFAFWREALLFLLLINAWTMFRFWQDKKRATAGEHRIPEADLLRLSLLGGSPGAFLARRLFRHKTRKQPFGNRLFLIAVVQLAVLVGLAIFYG